MKKVIFISLSILCFSRAEAQLSYGYKIGAGVSILGINSDFPDENTYFERFTNPISYSLGGIADYKLPMGLVLSSGLEITSKGVSVNYYHGGAEEYEVLDKAYNKKITYNCTYLRLPLGVKYFLDIPFLKEYNFKPYAHGGFAFDFSLNGDCGPEGAGVDNSIEFDYMKGLDINGMLGFGTELNTTSGSSFFMAIMLYKGFNSIVTDSYQLNNKELIMRNNALLFELGFKF